MPDSSDLASRYRPRRVTALFVGESSPPGAHFYEASGNLFRATQAAFATALGGNAVTSGEAFLMTFATKGCWLVELVDRPVTELPASERRAALEQGVARLAELLAE